MNAWNTPEVQPYLTQQQLQQRVQELGTQLTADYTSKNPLFLCLLKGSFLFFADLVRAVQIPLEVDFMRASSYGDGTSTSGTVQINSPPSCALKNRHVILVEDILDTGTTLHVVIPQLKQQQPASLTVCTLLDKPERRRYDIPLGYCGFVIPDVFVIGYGLDFGEAYRNLPYIGIYTLPADQTEHRTKGATISTPDNRME